MSPLPPTRRGACPALSRPMETGDGLLARLVPAEGVLSPTQLDGLAQAARACGNGLLEVSARGSLQVRGLKPETVAPLNEQVAALAIVPREGIALDISPLSGLDPGEIADARALAARLRARLAAAGVTDRLGAKVSVVLDGGGSVRLDALSADVRLRAWRSCSRIVWALALAGDAATARPVARLSAEEALTAAVDWLTRLAALGPSARMEDVLSAPDPASPLAPLAGRLPLAEEGWVGAAPLPEDDGPMRRTAALLAAQDAPEATPAPASSAPSERAPGQIRAPIGLFPLNDGTFARGFGVPFGQIEAETLSAFVAATVEAGARDLRPAPGRVLLACGLTEAAAARLSETAERLGLLTSADDPRAFLAVCPGAPACRSAHIPARAIAGEVARALAPLLDGSITAHLSACAKGCAHPAPAGLTFVGLDGGVGLVREGTAGAVPEAVLGPEAFLPALAALARTVDAARRPGEDARAVLARLGALPAATPGPEPRTQLEPSSP